MKTNPLTQCMIAIFGLQMFPAKPRVKLWMRNEELKFLWQTPVLNQVFDLLVIEVEGWLVTLKPNLWAHTQQLWSKDENIQETYTRMFGLQICVWWDSRNFFVYIVGAWSFEQISIYTLSCCFANGFTYLWISTPAETMTMTDEFPVQSLDLYHPVEVQ